MNRECLLSDPLQDWLRQKGYTPFVEVNIFYQPTDLVGIKGKEIICIEMKTCLTKNVIRQAAPLQLVTHQVYCAVATMPRGQGRRRLTDIGLGLLSVCNGKVIEMVAPSKLEASRMFVEYYHKKTLEACSWLEPGGTAGNPCMKGVGPAQDCYDRVQVYLAANPHATRDDIFKNVPNHYAHSVSMAGAMKIVADRRRAEKRKET